VMRRALRLVFGTEVKTYQLCAVLGLGTDWASGWRKASGWLHSSPICSNVSVASSPISAHATVGRHVREPGFGACATTMIGGLTWEGTSTADARWFWVSCGRDWRRGSGETFWSASDMLVVERCPLLEMSTLRFGRNGVVD
jgi:hypothetical protein